MNDFRYQTAHGALMHLHNQDPARLIHNGEFIGEETLYALRMVEQLNIYFPIASPQLEVAAMAHHLKRWEIKRASYPMDKQGYFQWRRHVAKHQLSLTVEVLENAGFDELERDGILSILKKENIKTNALAQVLEDVACMVFVQFYLEPFAAPHNSEKVVDIVRKTMLKMSKTAIEQTAQLPLSDNVRGYIQEAAKLLPNLND
jgi:hypothetical protein